MIVLDRVTSSDVSHCASLFAIGEAFVALEMHNLILRADLGDEVADQIRLVSFLDRQALGFVELEKCLQSAGNHGVCTQIDDHECDLSGG